MTDYEKVAGIGRRLGESGSVVGGTPAPEAIGRRNRRGLSVPLEAVNPAAAGAAGRGLRLRFGVAGTPFGPALLGHTGRGVCHLSFLDHGVSAPSADPSVPAHGAALQREWPEAELVADHELAAELAAAILAGDRPPLHVHGTDFQVLVWEALLEIPEGRVACYQEVARAVGRPAATRAVAGAVAGNRVGWLIPCHRVIRKQGQVGGYRWGPERKRAMLAWEAAKRR